MQVSKTRSLVDSGRGATGPRDPCHVVDCDIRRYKTCRKLVAFWWSSLHACRPVEGITLLVPSPPPPPLTLRQWFIRSTKGTWLALVKILQSGKFTEEDLGPKMFHRKMVGVHANTIRPAFYVQHAISNSGVGVGAPETKECFKNNARKKKTQPSSDEGMMNIFAFSTTSRPAWAGLAFKGTYLTSCSQRGWNDEATPGEPKRYYAKSALESRVAVFVCLCARVEASAMQRVLKLSRFNIHKTSLTLFCPLSSLLFRFLALEHVEIPSGYFGHADIFASLYCIGSILLLPEFCLWLYS